MLEIIINILLVSMAADAILTAWFTGSIFAEKLAEYESRPDRLAELMTCELCLAYWCVAVLCLIYAPIYLLPDDIVPFWRLPFIWLAVTTLVHRLRQVYPRYDPYVDEPERAEINEDEERPL